MDNTNVAETVVAGTEVVTEAGKGFFGTLAEKALDAASNHPVGAGLAGATVIGGTLYGLWRWNKSRSAAKLATIQAPAAPAADAQAPATK